LVVNDWEKTVILIPSLYPESFEK